MKRLRRFRNSILQPNSESGDEEAEFSADDSFMSASSADDEEDAIYSSSDQGARKPPPLQGWLQKQGEKGPFRSWKKRYFLQRNTKLYYYPTENTNANPNGKIDLSQILDILLLPSDQLEGGFQLVTAKRVYQLQANSDSDRLYWTTGLRKWLAYLSTNNPKANRMTFSGPIRSSPDLGPAASSAASFSNLFSPIDTGFGALFKNGPFKPTNRVKSMGLAPPSSRAKDEQISDLQEELAALKSQAGLSVSGFSLRFLKSAPTRDAILEVDGRLRRTENQCGEVLFERRRIEAEMAALDDCLQRARRECDRLHDQLRAIDDSGKQVEELLKEARASSVSVAPHSYSSALNEVLLTEELHSLSVTCAEQQETNGSLGDQLQALEAATKTQAIMNWAQVQPIFQEMGEIRVKKKELENSDGVKSFSRDSGGGFNLASSSRKGKKEKDRELKEARKLLFKELIMMRSNLLQVKCGCPSESLYSQVQDLPSPLFNLWVMAHFEYKHGT